jgi:hypothetical protein
MGVTGDFWTFAISATGELHVWQGIEMPAAVNVVHVSVSLDGDLARIAPADLSALRQLIGEETREVIARSGPDVADELEDLLTQIHRIAQARIDVLRGDDDEDAPPAPGM